MKQSASVDERRGGRTSRTAYLAETQSETPADVDFVYLNPVDDEPSSDDEEDPGSPGGPQLPE